jgi:hypothetical protein
MLSEKLNEMVRHYSVNHAGTKRALKTNHIQERGAELKTTLFGMQRIKAICEQSADVVKVNSIMRRMRMWNFALQTSKNSLLRLARAQMDVLLIALTRLVTTNLEMLGGPRFCNKQGIECRMDIG